MLQVRSDRVTIPPYGLFGGRPGTPSVNILNPGPNQEELPSKFMTWLKSGDVYRCQLASGRGWGDPFTRDPELVLQDVRNEKLSTEFAAREHGVVMGVDPYLADWLATERVRSAHLAERSRREATRPASDDDCASLLNRMLR